MLRKKFFILFYKQLKYSHLISIIPIVTNTNSYIYKIENIPTVTRTSTLVPYNHHRMAETLILMTYN